MARESPATDNPTPEVKPQQVLLGRPNVTLLSDEQWSYLRRRYHISPRELEIAKLVCQGLTNGDMARELGVQLGTVKTHLRSLFLKVRVKNRISLLLSFLNHSAELSGKALSPISTAGSGPQEATRAVRSQGKSKNQRSKK